ncbi:MAG: hypothetical protein LBV17_02605 [Treponema sp.]|jgi:hypothetical protein|nr:hypothetical protein [Treponema sp.]
MKKIIFFSGLILFVTISIFAQEDQSALSNINPIFITIIVIAHICLTIAVYKIKGGPWACFYFFLAPVVIFLLLLVLSSENKSNRNDVHHHFH